MFVWPNGTPSLSCAVFTSPVFLSLSLKRLFWLCSPPPYLLCPLEQLAPLWLASRSLARCMHKPQGLCRVATKNKIQPLSSSFLRHRKPHLDWVPPVPVGTLGHCSGGKKTFLDSACICDIIYCFIAVTNIYQCASRALFRPAPTWMFQQAVATHPD